MRNTDFETPELVNNNNSNNNNNNKVKTHTHTHILLVFCGCRTRQGAVNNVLPFQVTNQNWSYALENDTAFGLSESGVIQHLFKSRACENHPTLQDVHLY